MKRVVLYSLLLIVFNISCSDKKAEVESTLPENYHSKYVPQKLSNKTDDSFALTLNIKDSIFIIGNRENGKNVFLLNNETGDYCQARTGNTKDYYEQISDKHWQLTPVTPQPDQNTRYDLVFQHHDQINFQLVGSTLIQDSSTIADINKEIKLSGYIDTLLAYDDKFPLDSVIGQVSPKITKIDFPEEEAYVVTYPYVDSIPGPRMLLIHNKIYPLTGPCSYQHVYPFRINKRNFIQTGSSCCECDWVIDQVFEVAYHSVLLVFQDDSYSE